MKTTIAIAIISALLYTGVLKTTLFEIDTKPITNLRTVPCYVKAYNENKGHSKAAARLASRRCFAEMRVHDIRQALADEDYEKAENLYKNK